MADHCVVNTLTWWWDTLVFARDKPSSTPGGARVISSPEIWVVSEPIVNTAYRKQAFNVILPTTGNPCIQVVTEIHYNSTYLITLYLQHFQVLPLNKYIYNFH